MRPPDGRVVGRHPGVFYFTLGQPEGLELGGVRGFDPAPWYVVGKDVERAGEGVQNAADKAKR